MHTYAYTYPHIYEIYYLYSFVVEQSVLRVLQMVRSPFKLCDRTRCERQLLSCPGRRLVAALLLGVRWDARWCDQLIQCNYPYLNASYKCDYKLHTSGIARGIISIFWPGKGLTPV